MREIKFRGKSVRDNVWVFGDLITVVGGTDIRVYSSKSDLDAYHVPVTPGTVGQFTGLRDADGRKIYEGDLLEVLPTVYDECKDFKFPVFYHKGAFIVTGGIELGDFLTFGKVTIIGNIHDNPELLEVAHD